MRENYSYKKREAKAVFSSYIALGGIWAVLAIVCFILAIKNFSHGDLIPALICSLVTILWTLWLRGFKLTVTDEYLEYRDGLYRVSKVPLEDIAEMKHKWIQWKNFGRIVSIPRTAVITKDKKTAFLINDKPFGLNDLSMIRNMVKERGESTENFF